MNKPDPPMQQNIPWQGLAGLIDGDCFLDIQTRRLYASDASPYQWLPDAVVMPRHEQDCRALMSFASKHHIAVIVRSAGTSLAGQVVGRGMVLDVKRYMNRILKINPEQGIATIAPGVVRNRLNEELKQYGLMFAPDPSTSDYCTIGGMFGNNSWGIHALRYGDTRKYVESVKVALANGDIMCCEPLKKKEWQAREQLQNREGEIYSQIAQIIEENQANIRQHQPQPDAISRNTAYALDSLFPENNSANDDVITNITPLLCGSEGTLALVTELTVNLVPIPDGTRLLCLHFKQLTSALNAVAEVLHWRPSAVELLDKHILDCALSNKKQLPNRFWLQGEPSAVLLVELQLGFSTLTETTEKALQDLAISTDAYAISQVVGSHEIERVWSLRKAGLGLLMGMPGEQLAVTGFEDGAVAVEFLQAYVSEFLNKLTEYGYSCVVYGPVGRGTAHLRPIFNLYSDTGKQHYRELLQFMVGLIVKYQGALSGKHGDGRLRGYYLAQGINPGLLQAMQKVKNVFDPDNILNPDKLWRSADPASDLRYEQYLLTQKREVHFDWSNDFGWPLAKQKCNGAGVCLQPASSGAMCPSYQADMQERFSTRGRANLIRQVDGDLKPPKRKAAKALLQTLRFCLSCKSCKTECPANVDMAKMKAEFQQMHFQRFGIPLRTRLFAHFYRFGAMASSYPVLGNYLLDRKCIKKILGVHPDRALPLLSPETFSIWFRRYAKNQASQAKCETVLLIIDPYLEYFEAQTGQAAVHVLHSLGFNVTVTRPISLGRLLISQGMLTAARREISNAVKQLFPVAQRGISIISLEPSEYAVFKDEAADLLNDREDIKAADLVSQQVYLFDEFVTEHLNQSNLALFAEKSHGAHIVLHEHCHQKAVLRAGVTQRLFDRFPGVTTEYVKAGCCGMAGAFGYQKKTYALSCKIAELSLLPALRLQEGERTIVATGASCRQQIATLSDFRAQHSAEIMASWLADFSAVSHSGKFI